jgi:hypothetical protein
MKVIGKTICNTDLEFKSIVMGINIKECSNRVEEMEKEPITIPQGKFIKVDGQMEGLKDLEFVHGLTEKNMKVNGRIIKNMAKEFIVGLMEGTMKVTIETIKSMDTELILGQMEENILDNGRMIRGTEEEHMSSIVNYQRREYGKRIKELNGFKMDKFD